MGRNVGGGGERGYGSSWSEESEGGKFILIEVYLNERL